MSGSHAGFGRALALTVGLCLAVPVPGRAQWTWVDALGYGGAGMGVGALAAWDMEYDRGLTVIALAGAGGIALGAAVGQVADARLARGDTLGGAHTVAVVAGSVLAGATLGALASAALINGEGEGTPLGSDESTFVGLTVGGAALGAAVTWWRRDALRPRGASVTPTVSPEGGVGVQLRLRF